MSEPADESSRSRLLLVGPTALATIAALILLQAACGGSGTEYGPREQEAIRQAEQLLQDALGTDSSGVAAVESPAYEGDLWRVELDTPEGYRCIYMTSEQESGAETFDLLSVKSGVGCGDEVLYNKSEGGVQEPAPAGADTDALYDAAYKACYGPVFVSPTTVGDIAAARDSAYREASEDGCEAANADIEACVPPIYYDGVSPYYCDDGNGRYLKEAS